MYVWGLLPEPRFLCSLQVDREYRVQKALFAAGFPVPEPLLYCSDVSVIGTEFYVMEHVQVGAPLPEILSFPYYKLLFIVENLSVRACLTFTDHLFWKSKAPAQALVSDRTWHSPVCGPEAAVARSRLFLLGLDSKAAVSCLNLGLFPSFASYCIISFTGPLET